MTAAAERLYRLLIGPAEGLVSASSRILISPDGPLQTLPFAALVEPGIPGRRSRFLAERFPVHTVASATLYAELLRRRGHRRTAGTSIAAFGDPVYPHGQQAADEVALRSGVRGRSLSPLPGTGSEVREIARLFPKQVLSFLGPEATEENAKSLPPAIRYVHFGCHTLLNARSPLDSALLLSLPEAPVEGHENGILQAWEIFEDVRMDADIVTLSACESGLGTDVAGEGLVGLTRAFQYAGARSVLASLWNVADDSTAELMGLFYRKLKQGKPKDLALQQAQVAMIRRGYSPFHWAAFQLTGDWR
jgi:CHAT domain-containing protein